MSVLINLRIRSLCTAAGLWLAAVLTPFGLVSASGLQVMPTTVSLQPVRAADGLWLRNTGDAPINAQVRVYHWTQTGGQDQLTPTRALLASPPMLKLGVGDSQLVRVIRTGAPPTHSEDAYRVVVNELPVADEKGGLSFVLRYSIPVFLEASGAVNAKPELTWKLRASDGQLLLDISNHGHKHAQISDVQVTDASGQQHTLKRGLLGYVLPGMNMRWELQADPSTLDAGGTLHARVNGEPVAPTVSLASLCTGITGADCSRADARDHDPDECLSNQCTRELRKSERDPADQY